MIIKNGGIYRVYDNPVGRLFNFTERLIRYRILPFISVEICAAEEESIQAEKGIKAAIREV